MTEGALYRMNGESITKDREEKGSKAASPILSPDNNAKSLCVTALFCRVYYVLQYCSIFISRFQKYSLPCYDRRPALLHGVVPS